MWWKSFFNERVTIGYYVVRNSTKLYGAFCWLRVADTMFTLVCNPWPFISVRRVFITPLDIPEAIWTGRGSCEIKWGNEVTYG